jgi:hypothetical protein
MTLVGTIFQGKENSMLEAAAPSSAIIGQALRDAGTLPIAARYGFGWQGPQPRVTRRAIPPTFETRFAWLWLWHDDAEAARRMADLVPVLEYEIRHRLPEVTGSTDWTEITSTPYAPSLHGSLAWWTSGEAAATPSADMFPTGIDRFTIQPDSPDRPNPTPPPGAMAALKAVAWIVVPAAVGVTAWSLRGVFGSRHTERVEVKARTNPGRRRGRR